MAAFSGYSNGDPDNADGLKGGVYRSGDMHLDPEVQIAADSVVLTPSSESFKSITHLAQSPDVGLTFGIETFINTTFTQSDTEFAQTRVSGATLVTVSGAGRVAKVEPLSETTVSSVSTYARVSDGNSTGRRVATWPIGCPSSCRLISDGNSTGRRVATGLTYTPSYEASTHALAAAGRFLYVAENTFRITVNAGVQDGAEVLFNSAETEPVITSVSLTRYDVTNWSSQSWTLSDTPTPLTRMADAVVGLAVLPDGRAVLSRSTDFGGGWRSGTSAFSFPGAGGWVGGRLTVFDPATQTQQPLGPQQGLYSDVSVGLDGTVFAYAPYGTGGAAPAAARFTPVAGGWQTAELPLPTDSGGRPAGQIAADATGGLLYTVAPPIEAAAVGIDVVRLDPATNTATRVDTIPARGVADLTLALPDRDGDGLLDEWEVERPVKEPSGEVSMKRGIVGPNGDLLVELTGADPDRKDIFVEVDMIAGAYPESGLDAVLNAVETAFARAPVDPWHNGHKGIKVHFLRDDLAIPSTSGGVYSSGSLMINETAPYAGSRADRLAVNKAARLSARHLAVRRIVVIGNDEEQNQTDGRTVYGATYFTSYGTPVYLFSAPTIARSKVIDVKVDTFMAINLMHELGHTLGLEHGYTADGEVYTGIIPNYPSVMNYAALPYSKAGFVWPLDFSSGDSPDVDEASLDERSGIVIRGEIRTPTGSVAYIPVYTNAGIKVQWASAVPDPISPTGISYELWPIPTSYAPPNTPIDFDRNGHIDTQFVQADLDGDGEYGTIFRDWNDWDNLDFTFLRRGPLLPIERLTSPLPPGPTPPDPDPTTLPHITPKPNLAPVPTTTTPAKPTELSNPSDPSPNNRVTMVGGPGGTARVLSVDGTVTATVTPFPGFAGEVRTATGAGGAVVAGTGPGVATRVVLLDPTSGQTTIDFAPFEATFTGGVFVSTGDLFGSGTPDIIVSPDLGGGPRVQVRDGKTGEVRFDFFGIDDPNFRGGARTAVADVTGDGAADLIVAAGFGGGPRVTVYDGASLRAGTLRAVADFFAFEPSLRNGVYVAAGDVDGDGFADLIAGAGPSGGPRVTVFSGTDLAVGSTTPAALANFFAGDESNRGGVRVAVKDLDGDALADFVTGPGEGGGSRVVGYAGKALAPTGTPTPVFEYDDPDAGAAGVFVG